MTANIDWRPSYFHTESIDDDCVHGRVETEEQLTSTLECLDTCYVCSSNVCLLERSVCVHVCVCARLCAS